MTTEKEKAERILKSAKKYEMRVDGNVLVISRFKFYNEAKNLDAIEESLHHEKIITRTAISAK